MNGNKLAETLNRIFHIVFLLSFGYIFLSIIFTGYSDDSSKYTVDERPWIILAFVLLLVIFTAVYIFIQNYNRKPKLRRIKNAKNHKDRNVKIIIFSVVGALLVLQLIVGYMLEMDPVTDLENLHKYALNFAENGNFNLIQEDLNRDNYAYLIRYPNNFAILFLLSFLYRIAYLIFGYVPMYVPVVVNTLAINVSVLLMVFIARKIFGNRKAFMVLFLSLLFVPYYTYTPFFYTDSLSMPFGIGGIYLFICGITSRSKYKKYIMMAACGVLIFLGFKLKGSVILILAVAVVYMFLKLRLKKTLCLILALIAGFGVVSTVYTAAFNSAQIITKEQSDKYEYPYTHWIMMGLYGDGSYNSDDDMYTREFPDKQTKQEANIEEIKNRIKEYGLLGMINHITYKADWTWEDGSYYISHHIAEARRPNLLHTFILDKSENQPVFYIYSSGFQLFLIFMICMSILKGCIKPEINIQTFLKGIVFAVFIFFIIWETRSRYLFNFTPIFFLLAVDGFDFMLDKLLLIKAFVKRKIK